MAQAGFISWNKIIAVGASFGIPLVSILSWLLVYGTKLVDKVDNIQTVQVSQGNDIKEIKNFIYGLSRRVDTLQHHIELQDVKYSNGDSKASSLFTEKYVNGHLTIIPVR